MFVAEVWNSHVSKVNLSIFYLRNVFVTEDAARSEEQLQKLARVCCRCPPIRASLPAREGGALPVARESSERSVSRGQIDQ